MQKELFIERLSDLIKKKTYSGDVETNKEALDIVESWIENGCNKERIQNGKAEILLLGNGDLKKPRVGYLVHMDVVKGNEEQFEMNIDGDKLMGRGVSDMKYSIPIGVELLNQILKTKMDTSFVLAITTDEEIGGGEGGKYLADVYGFKPEVLIVPDGGDGFVFVDRAKGVAHVWIEAKGIPSHASRPWDGESALIKLVDLSSELLERYRENNKGENWGTTMNLGVLNGGQSTNQVCADAVLKLDFRFPETRSVGEIYEEVVEVAGRIDKEMKVTLAASGDPTYTDVKLELVEKFIGLAEKVLGEKMVVKGDYGASDARYWTKYNVPVIMTKPVGGAIHSDEEWISLESCLQFYKILSEYLKVV